MRDLGQSDIAASADAFLAWWAQAGMDCAVSETPVNWLRPVPVTTNAPSVAAKISVSETPKTLQAFHEWLASDPSQPERRWPAMPIMPAGPENAALMIVTDMPDPQDMSAQTLFADRAGVLLDAMLHAIGLERANVYLAALFTARPPGGMVEASDMGHAVQRMKTHIALARPERLLILGDRTIRALLPPNVTGNSLQFFNHDGGTVPVVATFHPRLLLGQPAAKAECWHVLQSLIKEMRS